MEFSEEDLKKILEVRKYLVLSHERCRDYKNNKNAIMREIDHVAVIEKSIKSLDEFLAKYVKFG